MKSQKILVWLNNGCYPGHTMFSCGYTPDELINKLKRGNEDAYVWKVAVEERKEMLERVVWCAYSSEVYISKSSSPIHVTGIFLKNRFEFKDDDFVKLSHEITHICQFFLPEFLDRDKEHEAEAYFHSHLMTQCLERLRIKPKPKLKPKTNESVTQPNS